MFKRAEFPAPTWWFKTISNSTSRIDQHLLVTKKKVFGNQKEGLFACRKLKTETPQLTAKPLVPIGNYSKQKY